MRSVEWELDKDTVIRIWRLVVLQALRDVATWGNIGREAFDWIFSTRCEEVCDALDVDYEKVKKAAYMLRRKEANLPRIRANWKSKWA
jgi:hypothetical protein